MRAPLHSSTPFRHLVIWGVLLCVGACLVWRLGQLHLVKDDFLKHQGDIRALRTVSLQNYRGMILDRNQEPLAVSSPVPSVWVNPQKANFSDPKWLQLMQILDLQTPIQIKIKQHLNKSFVYLKRQISPVLAKQAMNLGLSGLHIQTEHKRFYPTAEVAAHVVGLADIDNKGQEGLELALDEVLQGRAGQKRILKDRLGAIVDVVDNGVMASDGQDITLSIDSRIQYLAYSSLLKAVQQHKAKAGSIVVLNAKTFEVLAMANAPSFNPNMLGKGYESALRNRAVTDQFEPGSIMKPFSMAHILSSGQYYPHSLVNTAPGWLKIGGKTVRDIRNYGQIDLGTVIKKSSNVGISKLLLSLPPEPFYETLAALGFGQSTYSGFPGEVPGVIQYAGQRNEFALATLGFGYGISTTPLQLAQAYAILANKGMRRPVSFLKVHSLPEGEKVLSPAVAQMITKMLVETTEAGGTALKAQVPGYTIAGKTGTSRKVGVNGYEEDSHLALFAGFAPAQNPEIVIAVIIDEPTAGHYYGGQVAAPVFSNVMAGALRLMNVSPWGRNQEYLLVKK